jgi:hypothetical protein
MNAGQIDLPRCAMDTSGPEFGFRQKCPQQEQIVRPTGSDCCTLELSQVGQTTFEAFKVK